LLGPKLVAVQTEWVLGWRQGLGLELMQEAVRAVEPWPQEVPQPTPARGPNLVRRRVLEWGLDWDLEWALQLAQGRPGRPAQQRVRVVAQWPQPELAWAHPASGRSLRAVELSPPPGR
jgi:hypothetical protein